MKAQRYFSRPLEGTHHRRYFLLSPDGKKYLAVVISRPDGKEIPEPDAVSDGRTRANTVSTSGRKHWLTLGLNTKKPCLLCGDKKPISDFGAGEGRYSVSNFCKTCTEEQKKANRK